MHWGAFSAERPDLADEGRRLLYQFGVGLGFLATVAADGSPRVHPMCPVIVGDHLYALIEPGPKRGDLLRDGRYALHSFSTGRQRGRLLRHRAGHVGRR